QAEILARVPMRDPEAAIHRFLMATRAAFPDSELRITGREDLRHPPDSKLEQPPPEWKQASGLVIRKYGAIQRLYAWAHATAENGNQVTILAPITPDVLAGIVPGLGDIYFNRLMGHIRTSHLPPASNLFDFQFSWGLPLRIPTWDSPREEIASLLAVTTRPAA